HVAAPLLAQAMRRSGSGTKSGSSRGSMRSRRHAGADDIVLSNVWCPRKETVSTLLKLLHDHQLVQVRGTPASGKTTLMHLLHARIVNEDHNAKVYIYKHWPQNTMESIEGEERVRHYLPGYPQFQGLKTYFLFDEGQTSYWDDDLWLAFKDYIQSKQSKLVFVILFCSYGDRRVRPQEVKPTPLEFGPGKVTLQRTLRKDSEPLGLLLDKEEYKDVINRQAPKLLVTDDLQDLIYNLTNGHVGSVLAVVEFLLSKVMFCSKWVDSLLIVVQREASMLKGSYYSMNDFVDDNPTYDGFYKHLSTTYVIARGMPQDPAKYAQAIRTLLICGSIPKFTSTQPPEVLSRLADGHEKGFIHLDDTDQYTFTSPLYQQLWEWHLATPTDYELPFPTLFSFVEATIKRFKPSQLVQSEKPVEALYQKEYYCERRSEER
ncbi:hypothetical protein FRB91_004704, partial [Serendipita sp. 411]